MDVPYLIKQDQMDFKLSPNLRGHRRVIEGDFFEKILPRIGKKINYTVSPEDCRGGSITGFQGGYTRVGSIVGFRVVLVQVSKGIARVVPLRVPLRVTRVVLGVLWGGVVRVDLLRVPWGVTWVSDLSQGLARESLGGFTMGSPGVARVTLLRVPLRVTRVVLLKVPWEGCLGGPGERFPGGSIGGRLRNFQGVARVVPLRVP